MSDQSLTRNQKKLSAVVFCFDNDDYRRLAWGKLLFHHFGEIWLVSNPNRWRFFDITHPSGGKVVKPKNRPTEVDAVFVHTGDLTKLYDSLEAVSAPHRFYFSRPGTPQVSSPDLPICRTTQPFDLSDSDAKEIAEYVAGLARIPSCCFPRKSLEFLPAMALLSQAYLIVHAEHKGTDRAYWSDKDIAPALARIGWNDDMANEAADSLLIKPALGSEADIEAVCRADWWREVFEGAELYEATQKEWDEPNNGAMPEAVTELINQIQNSPRIAPPSRVAKAYCAIADRLERRRLQ